MAWTTPTNVATGDVLTASRYNNEVVGNSLALPRGYKAAAKITADVTGFSSTIADVTGLTATVSDWTVDRWYRITVQADLTPTVGTDVGVLTLTTAAGVALMRSVHPFGNTNSQTAVIVYYEQAASTVSTTRKVQCSRGSGTGTITVTASGTRPALILIEDMGTGL